MIDRGKDEQRDLEQSRPLEADDLIIAGIAGIPNQESASPNDPVKTLTVIPGYFKIPLYKLTEKVIEGIDSFHRESALKAGTTHHMLLKGSEVLNMLHRRTNTPQEKSLLEQLQKRGAVQPPKP